VARASHDDRDALALQADLERLFDRQLIFTRLAAAGLETINGRRGRTVLTRSDGNGLLRAGLYQPGVVSWRVPMRSKAVYAWALAAFCASELLARILGVRFAWQTLDELYQYLDPVILRGDLARGLFYLHAQPPFFNLFLGLVLKLFPASSPLAFSFIFGVTALGLLLGMAWLMRRLGVSDVVNIVVVFLFALTPSFPVYRNWLFYTLPVAALLVLGAISLQHHLHSGRWWSLIAFLATTTSLMMTRAVYHPLWLIVLVAALAPLIPLGPRRRLLKGSAIVLFLVGVWFFKNLLIVGSFSGSTWLGMSLAKRWPLSQSEIADLKQEGVLPPFWHRRPFQEPRELAPFGFFEDGPHVHPALDAPYKTNGEPNFNHRDYVAVSDAMLKGDLALLWRFPLRYLERVATAVLLFVQPGPNSVDFLVDYDFSRVHHYRAWLTRYVFLGGEIERPIRMWAPPPNLTLLVFPLLVWGGVRAALRAPSERRALLVYMLVNVVWVFAVANLVEIGENDRMRWEVEPFLAIFLALVFSELLPRRLKGT
jgi:hypothetical protein